MSLFGDYSMPYQKHSQKIEQRFQILGVDDSNRRPKKSPQRHWHHISIPFPKSTDSPPDRGIAWQEIDLTFCFLLQPPQFSIRQLGLA
jgi:hypothetical protein